MGLAAQIPPLTRDGQSQQMEEDAVDFKTLRRRPTRSSRLRLLPKLPLIWCLNTVLTCGSGMWAHLSWVPREQLPCLPAWSSCFPELPVVWAGFCPLWLSD